MPLLEFTVGLAQLMKANNNMSQAELARRVNVKRPYISRVMAGCENLTVKTMARLAAAAGGALHIAITERDERVRWVKDVVPEDELAPDLSKLHPANSTEREPREPRNGSARHGNLGQGRGRG